MVGIFKSISCEEGGKRGREARDTNENKDRERQRVVLSSSFEDGGKERKVRNTKDKDKGVQEGEREVFSNCEEGSGKGGEEY